MSGKSSEARVLRKTAGGKNGKLSVETFNTQWGIRHKACNFYSSVFNAMGEFIIVVPILPSPFKTHRINSFINTEQNTEPQLNIIERK